MEFTVLSCVKEEVEDVGSFSNPVVACPRLQSCIVGRVPADGNTECAVVVCNLGRIEAIVVWGGLWNW